MEIKQKKLAGFIFAIWLIILTLDCMGFWPELHCYFDWAGWACFGCFVCFCIPKTSKVQIDQPKTNSADGKTDAG